MVIAEPYLRTSEVVASRMTVHLQCILVRNMKFSGACAHATVHAAVVHKYIQNACYSFCKHYKHLQACHSCMVHALSQRSSASGCISEFVSEI